MQKDSDFFGGGTVSAPTGSPRDKARMGRSFVTGTHTAGDEQALVGSMRTLIRSIVREELARLAPGNREPPAPTTSNDIRDLLESLLVGATGSLSNKASVGPNRPSHRGYTMSPKAVAARGARDKYGRFLPKSKAQKKAGGIKK